MKQKETQVRVLDTVRAMSDEELRREVALLVDKANGINWKPQEIEFVNSSDLPDYPRDLNAMAEAEKSIPEDFRLVYVAAVARITYDDQAAIEAFTKYQLLTATARQRAEAFYQTLRGSNTGNSGGVSNPGPALPPNE